ncbi:hypothetical protein BN1013_00441 [Candidatus Rubidus massiliensis]|nr:hypothetical protein BN1013_00441 [Candidatus Rubidus massiliensis]
MREKKSKSSDEKLQQELNQKIETLKDLFQQWESLKKSPDGKVNEDFISKLKIIEIAQEHITRLAPDLPFEDQKEIVIELEQLIKDSFKKEHNFLGYVEKVQTEQVLDKAIEKIIKEKIKKAKKIKK